MADVLPINFPIPGESTLATYNGTDIATGTGLITFYGATDQTGAGVLLTNASYSDDIQETFAVATNTNYSLIFDKDFDVTLNVPLTVRGITTANIPFTSEASQGSNGTVTGYVIVKLRKWDGATETEIANGTSAELLATFVSPNQTHDHEHMVLVRFTTPTTKFKSGETLRITLLGYGKTSAATNPTAKNLLIAHDPQNRQTTIASESPIFTGVSKVMTINIPVKLNL